MAKNKLDNYNESVISSKTLEIVVLKQAQRELKDAPKDVVSDVFALFEDLAAGKKLGMPISRPLPSVGKGLHELRLSGRAGEYRVFYVIKVIEAIYVIHAATKKKQAMDRQTTELLKQRMRSLGL
jgi:phage-related protein